MELRRTEAAVRDLAESWSFLRRARWAAVAASVPSEVPSSAAVNPPTQSSEAIDLSSSLPSLDSLRSMLSPDRTTVHVAASVAAAAAAAAQKEKEEAEGGGDGGVPTDESCGGGSTGVATPMSTSDALPPSDRDASMDDKSEEVIEELALRDALSKLESLRERACNLETKAEKFRKRLGETDPVTGAPRYGEKTVQRVVALLDTYDSLILGLNIAFGEERRPLNAGGVVGEGFSTADAGGGGNGDAAIVESVRQAVERDNEARQNAALLEKAEQRRREDEKAEQQRLAEEKADRTRREEEEARKREEADLARRAEEARRARIEEEQRAAEADRAFLASVPKGRDGVRAQLSELRAGCASASDPAAFDTAIGALHTMFAQIVAHPEEPKFRRVRRDHPRFHEDVGRHPGGKEILVAAGFTLDTVEGVQCFFSREPNIETDMNGWSAWFDGLKSTLKIIEEEMMK